MNIIINFLYIFRTTITTDLETGEEYELEVDLACSGVYTVVFAENKDQQNTGAGSGSTGSLTAWAVCDKL